MKIDITLKPKSLYTLWWKFRSGEVTDSHRFYDGTFAGATNTAAHTKPFNAVMQQALRYQGIAILIHLLILPSDVDPNGTE